MNSLSEISSDSGRTVRRGNGMTASKAASVAMKATSEGNFAYASDQPS